MKTFREYAPNALALDPVKEINEEWMLITARKKDGKVNTMTASWGGTGELWNKPVAFLFVRPQRYTREFLNDGDYATVSFFDRKYRDALTVCGRKSGRDCDKIALAGLTVRSFGEAPAFEEANTVLTLKKLYVGRLEEKNFLDASVAAQNYPQKDYHYVYICEILRGYKEEK